MRSQITESGFDLDVQRLACRQKREAPEVHVLVGRDMVQKATRTLTMVGILPHQCESMLYVAETVDQIAIYPRNSTRHDQSSIERRTTGRR